MSQVMALDANELTTWVSRVVQTLDKSLREPARSDALASLRAGTHGAAAFAVLARLALLADCLRVAQLAMEADGHIERDELERVADLVRVSVPTFAAALPAYESFAGGIASDVDISRFVAEHRRDSGPFGYRTPDVWKGLALARAAEAASHNASPLHELERMLARVMDQVFAGRATDVERAARRKLRELFAPPSVAGDDPRAVVFCRDDGPEVFASVSHGSQVHERDPFDVEAIHAEARELFFRMVERANTPSSHTSGGRTLLLLGESGAGKTHLLRAFRSQVHGHRAGYVGYLQMTAEVSDYARYVLRSLVDSMERPYDAPTLTESALMYLSDGLADGRVSIPPEELERLRTAELSSEQLDATVGKIIDQIVRTEGLEELEVDILHALLLLQRRDPALQRRVIRFLRCEPLTTYDRQLLGGLTARDKPDDPLRTLRQLARVMYELQMAALVLAVDQIEETIPDGVTATRLQQAFDSLRAVADSIPSAVVVISCLDDVYAAVRPKLSRSLVDRLENDPGPIRLTSQRDTSEIEQMLVRRLDYLYASFDVAWRDDDPLFPFSTGQVEAVARFRARDCLAKFRTYHATCIAAHSVVPVAEPTSTATRNNDVGGQPAFSFSEPIVEPPPPVASHDLDRLWNELSGADAALPDDDHGLLAIVEGALTDVAGELDLRLTARRDVAGRLVVEGAQCGRRIVVVCNKQPQGGHLGRQLDALRELATSGTVPIALRSSDFQFSAGSKIAKQVGELRAAGGLPLAIEERELRIASAARKLAGSTVAGLDGWRRARRPVSQLPFIRVLLDLDAAPATVASSASPTAAPPASAAGTPQVPASTSAARTSSPIPVIALDRVRLGRSPLMNRDPHDLTLDQIKTHVAFLGGTGSGKTTAALSVIEQLLERGVSALLVDRKGDLARYASDAWWTDPSHPDVARKAALRERIDVALYTPGNSAGRPLRLPLVPSLADATGQERDQLALFAANGLAAMMEYGSGSKDTHKRSILKCAIELNAAVRDLSIDALRETIERPDPELLMRVGALQRHFASVAEDLQSLGIQRQSLLAGDGEQLDVAQLLPPAGARPRLSIISAAALSNVSILQFWVARLLVDLSRLARARPTKNLQAVAFFDEADLYVPATSAPPTKDPMFDLLRRARSGGIGIMLGTQSPGDFDYKARDNIGTWLVGKIKEPRAIDKMRTLLGQYPNVSTRLASQTVGQFFVLTSGRAAEVRCDQALMQTEQLSEAEVADLARGAMQR